jgi:hypothetical protein
MQTRPRGSKVGKKSTRLYSKYAGRFAYDRLLFLQGKELRTLEYAAKTDRRGIKRISPWAQHIENELGLLSHLIGVARAHTYLMFLGAYSAYYLLYF